MKGDTQAAPSPSFAVVSSTHFESGPPASKCVSRLEDGEIMETVREEAWEERQKKTTKTIRNIERRVQRQLVLEDGEIKEDSGPVITEDATEDTVTHVEVSEEKQRPQGQIEGPEPPGEGWIPVPGGLIVSEKCTKTVKSHDEVEDELETEEIQHCGDITNQEAEHYVLGQNDIRALVAHRQSKGLELTQPQKRIVNEATRRRGEIDTVEIKETSRIQDGHVETETAKTVKREEYDNESAPDSGSSISDGSVHETTKETSHNLVHTKDEDLLEYYAVPKGKSLAQGVKLGEGMHVVSEDVHEDRQGGELEPLTEKYKREGRKPPKKPVTKERTDAVTRRPIDFEEEEETRKSETNRWLEHHFGSESGRSGTSSQDLDITEGGNRITITMSPHPAAVEDVIDSTSAPRRWRENAAFQTTPNAPPPPPPKPGRLGNNHSVSTPPTSPSSPPMSPNSPSEIHQSELTTARARLRNTGVSLTEENKENDALHANMSRTENREHSKYISDETKGAFFPGSQKISDRSDEPVYSSRFSSGVPQKSSIRSVSPLPPPSSPPANVGRSQSFNVTTLPWSSNLKKKEHSGKSGSFVSHKDYRSEEKLDVIEPRQSVARRLFGRLSPSKETRRNFFRSLSPKRDKTPPPPPRHSRRTHESDFFAPNVAREASTQTGPSPIPPPRTKKKKRPKNTYFFGQDEPINTTYYQNGFSSNGTTERRPVKTSYIDDRSFSNHRDNTQRDNTHRDNTHRDNTHRDNTHRDNTHRDNTHRDNTHRDNTHRDNTHRDNTYRDNTHRDNAHRDNTYRTKSSPIVEKHYRTTHTITLPNKIVQVNSTSKYYANDMPKQNWTNTVDPRRRPRISSEEDRSTTLPRKVNDYYSLPKKQYFYGQESATKGNKQERLPTYRSSTHNLSHSEYNNELYNTSSLNPPITRRTKPVGRSHSFNVQPPSNSIPSRYHTTDQPLLNVSNQKTSTVYRSSPYLNLRSPNLIATIARSSSIRNPESPDKPVNPDDPQKTRFMEGLLNTAPELFHFIHGEEHQGQERIIHRDYEEAPSKNNRLSNCVETGSPTSPSASYSAKIFTFGKGGNNTLTRSASGGSVTNENNPGTTSLNSLHSPSSTLPRNTDRKTAFNLKTSGSSLLYSPSFRDRQKSEERIISKGYQSSKSLISGEYSGRSGISKGIQDENPALIQVKDWNKR